MKRIQSFAKITDRLFQHCNVNHDQPKTILEIEIAAGSWHEDEASTKKESMPAVQTKFMLLYSNNPSEVLTVILNISEIFEIVQLMANAILPESIDSLITECIN